MPRKFAMLVLLTTFPLSAQEAPTGRIIAFRPAALMGAALGCPIRHEGRKVVELGRGRYAEFTVPPGRYILTNKTSSVEVSVDAAETRYVRCMIKAGMLTGRADLQITDQADFESRSGELRPAEGVREIGHSPSTGEPN